MEAYFYFLISIIFSVWASVAPNGLTRAILIFPAGIFLIIGFNYSLKRRT